MGSAVGAPADYGKRAVAYLIDVALVFVGFIALFVVGGILSAISEALGGLVFFAGYVAIIVYAVWNVAYLQGTTGQTIGKRMQGIRLVSEETGQVVGFGMAFVRYLVVQLLAGITCGIYGLLDILWPLWDAKRQRITDKILKFAVIDSGDSAPFSVEAMNPFASR